MQNKIIGGVSPLKARKSRFKAGDVGKKATNVKAQDKSGFSRSGHESKGEGRSTKGRNYESNTGNTRLTNSMSIGTKDPSLIPATTGKDNFGDTKEFAGVETRVIPGKEGGSGNEFADNCYEADGSKKEGHVFYSEVKKMNILCKWGGKSDNSFGYNRKKTDDKDQYRNYTTDDGTSTGTRIYENDGEYTDGTPK